jgi:multicomponent Na+:H+ antiporter subunit E
VIRVVLILALVWVGLTGDLSWGNLVFAVLLAWAAAWAASPLGEQPVLKSIRPLKVAGLLLYLAGQIFVANLRVAVRVLGPRRLLRPALVAVPLDTRNENQIAILSNVVTLTPGTLSLDVSPDRKTLFVHAMTAASPDEVRRNIKDGFERRVMEAVE